MVVGTLLNATKAIESVRTILDPECFADEVNREIYDAIRKVDDAGDSVNFITVNAALRKAESELTLSDLISAQQLSTVGDLTVYALRLKELAMRRRMWELGQRLVSAGMSEAEDVDDVSQAAQDSLAGLFGSAQTSMVTLSDAYGELRQRMYANRQQGGCVSGTTTGFPELDRHGGLMPSDLIVIGGESSSGKTSLATAFAVNAISAGEHVAVYSMEMTAVQVAARIASMRSGASVLSITQSMLPESEIGRITGRMDELDMRLLHFDDRATSSIDNILASVRTMKIKYGIKGVVIDYLQILNVNRGRDYNKEQAMADAARRLKNAAKELDIWIIALSQFSRDKEQAEPDMNRLRDSGQIAEAADVVILLHRPEVKGQNYRGEFSNVSPAGTAMIKVAKGRNIGTFKFICGFDAKRTLFYPLTQLSGRGETVSGYAATPSLDDDGGEMPF